MYMDETQFFFLWIFSPPCLIVAARTRLLGGVPSSLFQSRVFTRGQGEGEGSILSRRQLWTKPLAGTVKANWDHSWFSIQENGHGYDHSWYNRLCFGNHVYLYSIHHRFYHCRGSCLVEDSLILLWLGFSKITSGGWFSGDCSSSSTPRCMLEPFWPINWRHTLEVRVFSRMEDFPYSSGGKRGGPPFGESGYFSVFKLCMARFFFLILFRTLYLLNKILFHNLMQGLKLTSIHN